MAEVAFFPLLGFISAEFQSEARAHSLTAVKQIRALTPPKRLVRIPSPLPCLLPTIQTEHPSPSKGPNLILRPAYSLSLSFIPLLVNKCNLTD